MSNGEKTKALDLAISQIEKNFGLGSIMRLGDKKKMSVEAISTGALSLDIALGVGGLPKGRLVEIFGPESSGKTTVSLQVIAEAQKKGGTCAFVDAEHALDPNYAEKLGVDVKQLLISQPDYGEQALAIVEALVISSAVDVVVLDSVAALVPKKELDGDMGDSYVGLQARLMSQALRKLAAITNKSKTVVIFINQLREKVGVMFGSPETTPGGRALKFYSSIRIDVRKIETLKKGDGIFGNRVRAKVVKNKVAPPFLVAEFDIIFGEGVSLAGDALDVATEMKIIEKSGTWFSYKGERIGQGRENAKAYFKENPKLLEEIRNLIYEKRIKNNEEAKESVSKKTKS